MPQVMCPNCGTTINLERRKEIDFALIKGATKKHPRTFTELLHITNLSRKTLSLRLKELCEKGILSKNSGVYALNGGYRSETNAKNLMRFFKDTVHDKRMKASLLLLAFLLLSSTSGYVLATLIMPKETPQEPIILGNFTMTLDISDIEDLYGWQVVIKFNSSELKVLDVIPGGFLGTVRVNEAILTGTNVKGGIFLNSTDINNGILLVGGLLCGEVQGKDGSGRLATILFGYFVDRYEAPKMVMEEEGFQTCLISSDGSLIPIENHLIPLFI
jgi:DNA-binding Lrp family transcriptional regulator